MVPMTPTQKIIVPRGLCHCGCGQPTRIAPFTSRAIGWVNGQPIRYIRGHANRHPRIDFSNAEPFKIDGVYCKLLSLANGFFTIVDAEDYEQLARFHWYALYAKGAGYYVVRHRPTKKKATGKHIYLHRFLLELSDDSPLYGDHRNGVTLDNRKKNLRIVTAEQNTHNHKMHLANTSGIEGVYWSKARGKWQAQIRIHGKQVNLGRRVSFAEAVALREEAEQKYRGEFRRQ
jgi:hypothetical protein